jgi:SAM-dependent methyltransferase
MTLSFAELITPADPSFVSLARQVYDGRQDVREVYPDPDDVGFRKWLAVHGVLESSDQLARFYPPVPPESLRRIACGGPTVPGHLSTSVDDFRLVAELWTLFSDRPFRGVREVYDFGCGCGRLMRWFYMSLPGTDCFGSDVEPESIAWCNQNLRGRYFVNQVQPPLSLPDRSLDLVVALSVFSHLTLESNLAWIRELARVCRPDGLMLLSTHGAFALDLIHRSREHQLDLHISAAEARTLLRGLPRDPFAFHRLDASCLGGADHVEEGYGQAFFTEAFVRQQWESEVDLLGCIPTALCGIQDMFVLRPGCA